MEVGAPGAGGGVDGVTFAEHHDEAGQRVRVDAVREVILGGRAGQALPELRDALAVIDAAEGRLDVLVNNAGVLGNGPLDGPAALRVFDTFQDEAGHLPW
jgi:NAD(P)-dependent dehydrogenase (short-subunit alcohol dehydrogenase family)